MKIKGLAQTIKNIEKMMSLIDDKIADNDDRFNISTNQLAANRDDQLHEAWLELDSAKDILMGIRTI